MGKMVLKPSETEGIAGEESVQKVFLFVLYSVLLFPQVSLICPLVQSLW